MTSSDVERLTSEFKSRFDAEVEVEQVGTNGRFRFSIISPRFRDMPQLDRQDAIWDVVDKILPRQATLDVSLILAFAPDELERAA